MARTIIQQIIQDYEIIGYPRLVRLNPNVPWKTRGNGALCIQVGTTQGDRKQKIGEINGRAVFCSPGPFPELTPSEQKDVARIVKETVETQAWVDDENTNPGYVLLSEKPDDMLYWKAVTTLVSLQEVQSLLKKHHAVFQGYKNNRGLIGATAAVCWEPGDKTFELITYRSPQRWGSKRQVDKESVHQMDMQYPSTFDNYDWVNHHNRIVPNSPCPILYGIRGNDPASLMTAFTQVTSETIDSWMLFETNQGTDDHLQRKTIGQVIPFESVIVQGSVVTPPFTIQGGHVLFMIQDSTGTIHCAAYEPTKEFRHIIRGLSIGDFVEVYGGVREQPLTINLEKISVQRLTSITTKTENPVCPACGKHMKSKGTNQGFKCRNCGIKSTQLTMQQKPRSIEPGFYEVPVCARRHLSKPLKRMRQQSTVSAIGTSDTP
ncbi:MAG: tRNA(Ile)(2)-agmatinylcytidine synthase [Candidatus Thermoplasmatota archaeon]